MTGSLELTIEKLVYGGDGLAHGPASERGAGKAIFLPFVLERERVQARRLEEKPGFCRAVAESVLEPSSARVQPDCPHFGRCGGCHYQHAAYRHQLQTKAAILLETLQRIGRLEIPPVITHPSPPWHYRNRTRLQVRGGRNFALGYFQFASHDLLPVEQCPISSPLINRAMTAAWQLGRARHIGGVEEIEFFSNAADDQLLVGLTAPARANPGPSSRNNHSSGPKLLDLANGLREALPEMPGVALFWTSGRGPAREYPLEQAKELLGVNRLVYRADGWEYQVSAGSFFQTNRYLIDELIQLVTGDEHGESALDLYAGTGLFSLPLSQKFRQLTAVESSPFSFPDLKHNVPRTVTTRHQRVEDFLQALSPPRGVDLVVVDPPRSGLGDKAAAHLGRFPAARITYVSCDPATLARDLRTLVAAGFHIHQMHLIDLFPQTFHIESVAKLVR